ncbi:hypothetical protein FI667_g6115, partial [Globisporangium splendens]
MAFLNGGNDEPSRPTTAQSKGRLVLQVTDFLLANKVAVVSIHEVQNTGQGSSSSVATSLPTFVLRTERSTSDGENSAAAEVAGFYVTAIDEVENEYALYTSRQKAEYLYRVEQENAIANGGNGASHPRTPRYHRQSPPRHWETHVSRAASTRREESAHDAASQKSVGKAQECAFPAGQAARSTRRDIAANGCEDDGGDCICAPTRQWWGQDDCGQRRGGTESENEESTQEQLTIWKSELESIHDDPSFRAIVKGIHKDDLEASGSSSMLGPIHSSGDKYASSTTICRRALPEKKTKHKELQERREKGRNARLRVTRETSSSVLHDIAASAGSDAAEPSVVVTPSRAATFEEIDAPASNSSQRKLTIAPSSRRLLLATVNSIQDINTLAGNAYSMKALEVEEQEQEQETFLRKRSVTSAQKRVLKADSLFNEIPGMGVEITNERPVNRGSLSLLGSPRGDDLMREVKLRMQENARRSSLVRDENGNLRQRLSLARSASRRKSLLFVDDGLATSASAPELPRKEENTELEHQIEARSPRLKIPTPRRVGSADSTPRQIACNEAEDDNQGLFATTRAVSSDSSSPRDTLRTERDVSGRDLADSVHLSPRYGCDVAALGTVTPRSSRMGSTPIAPHIIEIQEGELEQNNDTVGEERHDDDAGSNGLNGGQQASMMCEIQFARSTTVVSPRQACWGEDPLNEEGLLSTPLSPRTLPCVEATVTQQQTARGRVEDPQLQRQSDALDLRTRSFDQFPAKTPITRELSESTDEESLVDSQQVPRTKSLDRVDAITAADSHPSHTEDASNNIEDTAASTALIIPQERIDCVDGGPVEDESADLATHDESESETNRGFENMSIAAIERTELELVGEAQGDNHDEHDEHHDEQEDRQSNEQNGLHKFEDEKSMDQEKLANEVVFADHAPLSPAENLISPSETRILNAHAMSEPKSKKSTVGMGARRSSTKSSAAAATGRSPTRESSKSPSKKSKYAANSSAQASSSENRRLSEHRESSLGIPAGFYEAKDASLNDFTSSAARKSIVKATNSHYISGDQPDIAENGPKGKANRAAAAGHTKRALSSSSLSPSTAFLDMPSTYHKKWGKWLNGRFIVDKISCMQLEELVLQDPQNEKHLVKLGLRYARWFETSLAAILLLEHGGPAVAAVSNLEKADDVFRDLRAKFATFCDKDRPNLLFLHFQILCRLHMYHVAAECMKMVLSVLDAASAQLPGTDSNSLRPTSKLSSSRPTTSNASQSLTPAPYDATDYMLMLMHSQQSSGDYVQASATFSTILKVRHMAEAGEGGSSVLRDDQNLEIWHSLAEKCFFHEEHSLALEFYSIALNFAKDSHVLANIHFHRGLCFQAIGDDANCVTEYKRARNLNRHVSAPVAIAELHAKYADQFAVLLRKPIKLVIDEVRVLLYDKAVKKLQRIFRRKQHQQKQNNTRNATDSVKKPHNGPHVKRTASSSSDKYDRRSTTGSEATGEGEFGGGENGSSIGVDESAALSTQDKIRAIRSDAQFQPARYSPLHSPLVYVLTTMVSVAYWENLLVVARDLYETRSGLYRCLACVRNALPHITDAVAYCALAECAAQVDEAIEKLHDPTYERDLACVCTILDVSRMMMAQQQNFHDASRAPSSTSSSTSRSMSGANSCTDSTHPSGGVRFPAIASNDPHHSPRGTSGSQALNAHVTTTSRRVVLPYFGSSYDLHGAKSVAKEKPTESSPSRLTEMVDAHFQERKHATLTDPTPRGLHSLATETVTVLHDFREINNAVLLSSQQPFGAFMNCKVWWQIIEIESHGEVLNDLSSVSLSWCH